MVQISSVLAALLVGATSVAAHGDIMEALQRRQMHLNHPNYKSMSTCKRDLTDSGWIRDRHMRREERLHELRVAAGFAQKHELVRRDPAPVEESFGTNASCILDPELGPGPYWVRGEHVRYNLVDEEKGALIYLDINLIDVTTCKPLLDTYIDLWSTNSSGIYLGVQDDQNGTGSGAAINSTALRGIQSSGKNGTASFRTLVPGHYSGRTNHFHIVVHHDAKLLPNNTIAGGTLTHGGQFFFPRDILDVVEASYPYNLNTVPQINIREDNFWPGSIQNGDDPFLKINFIGKTLADGLFATIDVGINPAASYVELAHSRLTAEGTFKEPNNTHHVPT